MNPFTYLKAKDTKEAVAATGTHTNSTFIGGGTNIVDLMKMNIEMPQYVIDITSLDLKKDRSTGERKCAYRRPR